MDSQKKPTLFLLPNVLDPALSSEEVFPPQVGKIVSVLDGLIAESEKGAHLFLRRFQIKNLPLQLLNEHTTPAALKEILAPLQRGEWWGLISDCGMPCLADPGADLVHLAHKRNIKVEAIIGPSAIILSLLLSGLKSQNFSFHGYLPREEKELSHKISLLTSRARTEQTTHLCIEAPYRSLKLFSAFLKQLPDTTLLCVAADLMLPSQYLLTQTIAAWKKQTPPELKRPTIFLFQGFP
jgi:16S rRNA (cytidine1402-2'-O)-methyltransferase